MMARPLRADSDERRQRRFALVATLLLNGVFLMLLDQMMRPYATLRSPGARPDAVDVLLVRLIDPAPLPQAAAVVVSSETAAQASGRSAPPTRRLRRTAGEGRASAAEVSQQTLPDVQAAVGIDTAATRAPADALESAAAPLRLYGRTGSVLLPDTQGSAVETAPFPDRPRVAQEGNPFVHHSPLPYTPTRLDKYWPSTRETLGGELVRKATVKRAWRTPWGTQVECVWVLFFGGCRWGPEPRATAEELQQMRVDPPMPRSQQTGDDVPSKQ